MSVERLIEGSAWWTEETESVALVVTVVFSGSDEECPYSTTVNETDEIPKEIWDRTIAGEAGPIKPYSQWLSENVAPEFQNNEYKIDEVI